MDKKSGLIIAALIVLVLAAVLLGSGVFKGEAAIITNDDNTISLVAKRSGDGSGGTGIITVKEGEHLHLDYSFTKGRVDLDIGGGSGAGVTEFTKAAVEGGDLSAMIVGEDPFGEKGISGTGSLKIKADPGEYTVLVTYHNATGEGTLSAVAD